MSPSAVRSDGTITVAHDNGVDTLESIERLQFDDGTLAFDFDGTTRIQSRARWRRPWLLDPPPASRRFFAKLVAL